MTRGLLILLFCACAVYAYQFSGSAKITFTGGPAKDAYVIVNTDTGEQYISYTNTGVTEVEAPNSKTRYQKCNNGCRNFYFTLPIPRYGTTSSTSATVNGVSCRVYSYTVNSTPVEIYYAATTPAGWNAGEYIVRVIQKGNVKRQIDFGTLTRTGTIPSAAKCTPTEGAAVQCSGALDLAMVIDGSGSITDADYTREINYALDVVNAFQPSANGIHIGYITFATTSQIVSRLSDNANNVLVNKIKGTKQMQGETNIGDGLSAAYDLLYNVNGAGYRSNEYPKIVLLLTDGRANRPNGTNPNAVDYMITAANKVKNAGAKLYAVGVGNQISQDDLDLVASTPTAQFTSLVTNFDDLKSTLNSIISEVCTGGDVQSTCTTTCDPAEVCGCDTCVCPLSTASCGTRGSFNSGSCQCECSGNWSNGGGSVSDCSVCSLTCKNGGILNSATCACECQNGFTGTDCSTCTAAACDSVRQTQVAGTCRTCQCKSPYTGINCQTCPDTVCNGHGTVNNPDSGCNSCTCTPGTWWSNSKCDYCNQNCNGHGTVNAACDACTCTTANGAQWTGTTCGTCSYSCDPNYSTGANSACTGCKCKDQWTGNDCKTCPVATSTYCGSHGHLNATNCKDCICDINWKGTKCTQCDWDCNGRGFAQTSANCANCTCNALWSGTHCEICDTNQCGVNGFMNTDSCTCTCNANFTGTHCEKCVAGVCKNGGTPKDQTLCDSCNCKNFWGGDYCETCTLNCVHGRANADCSACVCDDFWLNPNCNTCDNGGSAQTYLSSQCSNHGRLNSDCTQCACNYPYNGTDDRTCKNCAYNCNAHGSGNDACNGCVCQQSWDPATDCLTCDTTSRTYCNNRGTVNNTNGNCNTCTCDTNSWSGQTCQTCNIGCQNGGSGQSTDCTTCACPNYWTSESKCSECGLTCAHGGTVTGACAGCQCVGGYKASTNCTECDFNYHSQCVHAYEDLADCQCNCTDRWDGPLCNTCPISVANGDCNVNDGHGSVFNGQYNGKDECRCKCLNFWVGDDCQNCGLDPEFGDLVCDGIGEPKLDDCTCHCPEYYRDEEGCRVCEMTLDDCAHPAPNTTVDTTYGVCSCTCDGNWSGRNCSICALDCSPKGEGWYLDETTCECITVCGDGIVAGDEECELDLVDEEIDRVCCDECKLVNVPCDDGVECTFDDLCVDGECYGIGSLNWEIDQDRNSLPTGPFNTNSYARWGLGFSTSGPINLNVVNSATSSDVRYRFPNNNAFGGQGSYGKVLSVTQTSNAVHSLTITFSPTRELKGIILLSVNRQDTTVIFECSGEDSVTKSAYAWGIGSAQAITSPCTNGVNALILQNIASAAIAELSFCDTPRIATGALGDYVWHDYTRDNIQDSFELGIPRVTAVLKIGNTVLATTQTDQNGLYLFDNLFASTYSVTFYGPAGYQFSTPSVVLLNRNILNEGSLVNVPLATGQIRLDVDVGLYLYGSIGDYVFLDDNQNGIQDDSIGVEGITLQLYHADDHSTVLATDVTRSTGRYIFNNLPVYKNATSFAEYQVKIVALPNKAVLTTRFAGSDIRIDSNFGEDLWSDVRQLLPSAPNDLTVDAGIYYCCGSIGDTVWLDNDKDGLQVSNEPGVPDVVTTLYRNDEPYKSTTTDANGKYLFTDLPLSGEYQVHWTRPSGYVWTLTDVGNNDLIDSDADRDGYSGIVVLTRTKPDDLSVDAGVKVGCTVAAECSSGTYCQTATCESNVCVYTPSGICDNVAQGCYDQVCDERSASCVLVPTVQSNRACNDENPCTIGDVCVPGTGVCRGTATSRACDDGNPCTEGDICNPQGVCAGTPKNCNAGNTNPCVTKTCNAVSGVCESSPVEALCSDNNRCTINDICVNGTCVGEPKSCGNNNVCKSSTCNPLTGVCSTSNVDGGCDDGNACTINDVCAGGKCAGTPKVCNAPSTCYSSACSFGNCVDTFLSGKSCDDGNQCTTNDRCDPVSGTCKGTAIVCNPSSTCVTSACVAGTCVETPIPDATCDDGDLCTVSSCESGRCVNTRIVCNDYDACTDDSCNPRTGECVFTDNTALCDDGNLCTTLDRCTAGECRGTPVNCDDGNLCTTDSCDASTGECKHDDNTVRCDDGNACTPTDVCTNGVCVGYDAVSCSDVNPGVCKDASCNRVTGFCDIFDLDDNSACDDGDQCTQDDGCVAGVCQGVPLDCTNGNPCLRSVCEDGACVNYNVEGACDDGNGCTVDDACVEGVCVGTPRVCNDENLCTDDSCVDGECVFEDNTLSCNDNDACTINDVCTAGECAGTPRTCVSENECLDAVCVDGECTFVPNTNTCSDGNACTSNVCEAGVCTSTVSVTCPEPADCVEYECNSATGECDAIPVEGTCDDGNPCTVDDRCVAGICVAGDAKECTSDDPCLAAFCDTRSGECATRARGNLCDDGNRCTRVDTCIEGECVGTNSVRCSTDNQCQVSTCNPATGSCEVENVDGACNDRDPCTENDVCVDGECKGTVRADCIPECVTAEECTEGNACETARCDNGKCLYTDANKCEDDSVCVARECNTVTGECDAVNTDNSCDDANLCTRTDVCRDGECVGTQPVTCAEKTCFVGVCDPASGNCNYEPTPDATCDDGNSCTVNDRCTARGTCEGTPLACASSNPCITSVCQNGQCVERPNTKSCDDGNACTKNDRCDAGVCRGSAVQCETSNPCAESVCVAGQCTERPVDSNTCNDNDPCTTDACVNGKCVGTPIVCSGSVPECMENACMNGVCVSQPSNAACDDGNPCTENDVCVDGVCEGVPKDCSDYDTPCGSGVCVQGTCFTDTSVFDNKACRSSDPCLVDTLCVDGECVGTPKNCNNGNECSTAVCTPGVGCEYSNNPITCTGRDLCSTYVCVDQRCVVSETDNCDDNNPCTADACNARTGECNNAYDPTAVCSDNDPCTVDRCTPEGCVSEEKDCDDQNECTNDYCRDGVCVNEPNFKSCSLDLPCVAQSQCNAQGVCSPVANVTCGDSFNRCTQMVCDQTRGCVEIAVDDETPCEDNDACTASSVCIQGVCTAGRATVCPESSNTCEMPVCDRVSGCGFVPNPQGECEDDDPCTTHSCENGVCVSTAVVCEDTDACTFNHECGANGCVFEEFSCVLNPCVTLECDGVGKCLTRRQSDNWNPRLYLGLANQDGTNLVVTANADNDVVNYFTVTDPIRSIAVQPVTGAVFAIGGSEGRTLFQIRKFSNGTLNPDLVVLGDVGANGLDLSFHPIFRSVDVTYNYELMALSRDSNKFITFQDDNFVPTTEAITPNAPFSALTWDNHGRFLYGAVGKQIYALRLDVDVRSEVICNGRDVIPEGTLIDLQMRVNEKLVGVVQNNGNMVVFAIDLTYTTAGIVCEVEQYTLSAAPLFALPAVVDSDATEFSLITAAAFDETICLAAAPPPTGTTGTPPDLPPGPPPTNDGTTGTSSGNMPPPPRGGTTGAAANPNPTYPGDDTNYVLTGGMASVSTAVVGSVGAGSVAIFAIFAVVFSLNNTKKDPAVPLSAVLEETEAANLAADNPIFQAQAEGISNVIAA